MVTQRHEQNEKERPSDLPSQLKPVTADSAGVAMTGHEFNSAHKDMLASAKPAETTKLTITNDSDQSSSRVSAATKTEWQPSLKADPVHDWDKTDFLAWTGNASERLGFSDEGDNKTANAFRHVITAAIYTMKYGASTTSELGWMNEQKDFNIVSSLRGKIDFDKISDTNADLLNNQSGIKIAQQLIKEKGAGNVTIQDLENRAAEAVRQGVAVIHPDQELRSGRLAKEILSYHSMPGLIEWEAKNGPTELDRKKAQQIVDERHLH